MAEVSPSDTLGCESSVRPMFYAFQKAAWRAMVQGGTSSIYNSQRDAGNPIALVLAVLDCDYIASHFLQLFGRVSKAFTLSFVVFKSYNLRRYPSYFQGIR